MKTLVLHGKMDLRVEERPVPEPGPGEVLVKVRAATTCGTDFKVYRRGYHPVMIQPPAPFGHEFSGEVAGAGAGADPRWREGLPVVAANAAPCGRCVLCEKGQTNLCEDLLFLNGAYSQYLVIPERIVRTNLLEIPESVPFERAAMLEPVACALLGIEDLGLREGEEVLVVGSGPMGLLLSLLASEAGCRVLLAGRGEFRLGLARGLLEIPPIDVEKEDLTGALAARLGHRRGPDAAIDATGTPEVWETCVRLVRRGGRVNFFGGCARGSTVKLDTERLHYGGVRTLASFHHTPATVRRALDVVANGRTALEALLTVRVALESMPGIFRESLGRKDFCKICVDPTL
jgi:L-iditol 2-dehydrogenase